MLTIIRTGIQKSGHILNKSPLHGVLYSTTKDIEKESNNQLKLDRIYRDKYRKKQKMKISVNPVHKQLFFIVHHAETFIIEHTSPATSTTAMQA